MDRATPGSALATDPVFARWLGERMGSTVRVAGVAAPTGGGWSNQTLFLDVLVEGEATPRGLVMKMAPTRMSMFRVYDLTREQRCLDGLSGGWPPVPRLVGTDQGDDIVGRPFHVMERISGRVPADEQPSFMQSGFLFEADAGTQRSVHDEILRALAALHRVDPEARNLASLGRTEDGATPLARELCWLRELFEWGGGPAPQPDIEAAFVRAFASLPDIDDAGLSWGDARPANIVFDGFRIAAVLDWELATLGPRELDVFWFLEMNAMRARGKPLPGFPTDAEAIAFYEGEAGVRLREPIWFRHFSALKVAVLMLRHLLQRVDAGLLPPDHPVLTDNVATRRLRNFDRTA